MNLLILGPSAHLESCAGEHLKSINNRKHCRQQTPLLLAVSQGHEAIVERLLKSGAGVNVQDEDGDTPLHVALIKRSALRGTELVETSDAPGMAQILATLATSPLDAAEDKGLLIACYLAK